MTRAVKVNPLAAELQRTIGERDDALLNARRVYETLGRARDRLEHAAVVIDTLAERVAELDRRWRDACDRADARQGAQSFNTFAVAEAPAPAARRRGRK